MSLSAAVYDRVRQAGFHAYRYPDGDERFSSLVPDSARILCCLKAAVKRGGIDPVGTPLIVYPNPHFSIVFSLGGVEYLVRKDVDLPQFVIDALANSSEQPMAVIDASVVKSHRVDQIAVYSIYRQTDALARLQATLDPDSFDTDVERALGAAEAFLPSEFLTDLSEDSPVAATRDDDGVVTVQCGNALAVGYIPNPAAPVVRIQLAHTSMLRLSTDAHAMMLNILAKGRWTIYDDGLGEQLNLHAPSYLAYEILAAIGGNQRALHRFMIQGLVDFNVLLPAPGKAALEAAIRYWGDGSAARSDLELARNACWDHLLAGDASHPPHAPEDCAVRAATCLLHLESDEASVDDNFVYYCEMLRGALPNLDDVQFFEMLERLLGEFVNKNPVVGLAPSE